MRRCYERQNFLDKYIAFYGDILNFLTYKWIVSFYPR